MRALRRFVDAAAERRKPDLPDCGLDIEGRLALTRLHGDFTLAHAAATQPGLAHFGGPEGFVAHAFKMGSTIALGDPVCAADRRGDLLDLFIAAARNPCFAQVTKPVADLLAARGYLIALLGCDFFLDLPAHDFSGGDNKSVRYSHAWLNKHGYRLGEWDGSGAAVAEAQALSDAWRGTRIVSHREMSFLNAPFAAQPFTGTRRFVLHAPDGRLDLLLDFHPMHREGKVTSYTTAIKRKHPQASAHAEIGLTKHAVETFAAEGVQRVTLGLAPLAITGRSGFRESALLRALLRRLARSGPVNARVFNLQGHAAFKRRFHGREEPVYFAWRGGSAILHFTALMRLSKLV